MGAGDFDVIELHDAAAPAELMQYHEIGLCAPGDGFKLIREGATDLGGRIPVNTSGGLLSRGHPLGATGCAQIVELVHQLRGTANNRQVEGARRALAVNGGGWLDGTYALAIATILERA
jgi:acetyl-CoA acyltransferase